MQAHDPNYRSLNWMDVARLVYDLHDFSLDPYMVRWPRLAWLALEKCGLTGATSEVDRLESKLRAVSVTHLHMQFLSQFNLGALDTDHDDWLEGIITLDEMELILARRYGSSSISERMSDAFERVYLLQLPDIVRALHGYFGSFTATYESLIDTASGPGDLEASLVQLGSAHDFLRIVFEEIGGVNIDKEFGDATTRSVYLPSNNVHEN